MKIPEAKFSLLLTDDDPSILALLRKIFSPEDYHLHTATDGGEALALLKATRIDAALVDWKMPGMDGLDLLKEIRKSYPSIMVVMLTGEGGIDEAVEAIKLGAVDFLTKPFSFEGLRARVRQLCRIWELKEENQKLREKIDFQFGFDRMVGNTTSILKLKQLIIQAGSSNESVLITGETGTGKELVARALHYHSLRSGSHFIPVDCAAISETVIESELFGHVKGAFTGAYISTLGLIRSADKGTLFLDEVGELSTNIQVKLLRTIQEREVRPVGSSKSYPVDIRIVAATKRDLVQEVSRGTFREDLFFRLNVIPVSVPPLRERKEDIPLLAAYFLERLSTDLTQTRKISPEALISMENYHWPGNIRELENTIRRAMALGKTEMILPEHLPPNIYAPPEHLPRGMSIPVNETLESYEEAAIRNALHKSGGNRKKAARILGIGEATLYRKIGKYGIQNG